MMNTYISLFSGAGIGCYGFKQENFECIATNELIQRRLDIQKFNQKCKYESGYICGDISQETIKQQLFQQIDLWKTKEYIKRVDIIVATPPCQGMSIANHKKKTDEIIRNSLVIESIKIIQQIKPKFFIFENVPAFMKTICTDIDGKNKTIEDAIYCNLGNLYSYTAKIINFKNYGACSSRQRTLVIGVANDYADEVSPFELFPSIVKEKTLRKVIGHLKPLNQFGEIDEQDIYHSFRVYPEHMRSWICDLKEGESAFDNIDDNKKPHQIINGKIIINQQKNGDKYKRQFWDKVGPCIHTRNDQLASQNTIHPQDDRVFSIREIMEMMTIPDCFKWVEKDIQQINQLSIEDKRKFLKKEEIKIRQSLGESVPTIIFQNIAKNIKNIIEKKTLSTAQINKIITEYELYNTNNLIQFIQKNELNLSISTLSRIAELSNSKRLDNAAYFTSKSLITEIIKNIPDFLQNNIKILEPSVGIGNFIPLIIKKFAEKNIEIDVIDIDKSSINILQSLIEKYNFTEKFKINYICDDFLLHHFDTQYDLIIGNPPFNKLNHKDEQLFVYKFNAINKETTNICSFFLDKAVTLGNYIAMVFPKFLLNTPEFSESRKYLNKKNIDCIIDFGEKGFPGVLVETIAIHINNTAKKSKTKVISVPNHISIIQNQDYIFDEKLPYWVIYRNDEFDKVSNKLDLNVFTVFRDRQITNSILNDNGEIRVIKSRNISDNGQKIENLIGYDSYITKDKAKNLSVYSFFNRDDVYLTPNMTYKPRVLKKPTNTLVNGSVAILLPKNGIKPTDIQLAYFSTDEYRRYYRIARNYQTRSLNVDSCSVYFYGLLKEQAPTFV
ncbi:MAG: DNA cytosine methyltransferase [Neisseriaceae bacterium]|nr:DNA cytosine methyltransferase [Neisseriaceae bacterium]